MEAFGRRIAKGRAELGWTQSRLAERIAVSRVALSHLEAGMSVANERTVVLLAATFGVEPHALVAGTDFPAAKAERLPLVAARHTEVDLQLALLAADLRWVDALAAAVAGPEAAGPEAAGPEAAGPETSMVTATLAEWRTRLAELEASVADPSERERVSQARRLLALRVPSGAGSGGAQRGAAD